MHKEPDISVVMPTYNRGQVIAHAIRSVIDQTLTNWELIIVDDGSTDGTKRIVDSFSDHRIIYKKIDHCGFVSKVRNEGNKLARAEIIVVHDSDDIAFPDRLEEIWNAFHQSEVDLIYHGMYQKFYDPYHGTTARSIKPVHKYDKERLLTEQYIPGQVAYKRKRILETPYDERIRCCDDYQMLLEFALRGYVFQPLYKNLYEYVDSVDSINVSGEMDGSRKRDLEVILSILKEKYGIEARARMTRHIISTGEVIKDEII